MNNLITELRGKLAGSTSQHPVDFEALTAGHQRQRVLDTLQSMEADREVCRCLIIKRGVERTVWWSVRTGDNATVNTPLRDHAWKPSRPRRSRMGLLSRTPLSKVISQPGISRADLIVYGLTLPEAESHKKVLNSIGSLRLGGHIEESGDLRSRAYTAARVQ